MPPTHLHLALVSLSLIFSSNAAVNVSGAAPPAVKTILDQKRRSDLVDEAFLEQKDVLLDMLEVKLKEVRDKKKKKGDSVNSNYLSNTDSVKCEPLPKNVDLNMNAHGISAIGEADVKLKFGNSGNGILKLDASGISNIGKTHVDLGVGDGSIQIPGLNNIFAGLPLLKSPCDSVNQTDVSSTTDASSTFAEIKEIEARRLNSKNNVTLDPTTNNSTTKTPNVVDGKINENNAQKEIQRNDLAATNNVVTVTTNPVEIPASSNAATP